MQTADKQTRKLLREYTSLAPSYDRRWSAYIDASLAMTGKAITDLPATRILDVACGTGLWLEMLAQRYPDAELFGIDRVPAMLAIARNRTACHATLLEADATKLPFGDSGFQLVTTTNALHYFPDVHFALTEIRRVLDPSGNLVITDWCRDYFWMKFLNSVLPWTRHAHGHTFSHRELEKSLLAAGFEIVTSKAKKIDGFWALMTVHARPTRLTCI